MAIPSNLIVRPSALVVNGPPPRLKGFDAGTTVHTWDARDAIIRQGIHICPAYDIPPEQMGRKGSPRHSCKINSTGQECRVCWDRPDVEVSYQLHSSISPKKEQLHDMREISRLIATTAKMHRDPLLAPPRINWRGKEKIFTVEGGAYMTSENIIRYPSKWAKLRHAPLRTSFLSLTAKIACFSFSLQGGHPSVTGGVCTMGTEREMRRLQASKDGFALIGYPNLASRPKGQPLICANCYATGNRYIYKTNVKQKAANAAWIDQYVGQPGTVAQGLVSAISHMTAFLGSASEPVPEMTNSRLLKIDPEYFRFFDAGDLGYHASDLLNEIIAMAISLPMVKFWLPTRTWVYAEVRQHIDVAGKRRKLHDYP